LLNTALKLQSLREHEGNAMRRMCIPFVLLLSISSFAADPQPYLKSALMPFYPPLARQAQIAGKVTLDFVVNELGDTSEITATVETKAVYAKDLLRQAAIENIQNWKFAWPHSCSCRAKQKAIFFYKFSGKLESPEGPTVTVRWFGKTGVIRVEIDGDLPQFETSAAH
jgi:hypothetical protein